MGEILSNSQPTNHNLSTLRAFILSRFRDNVFCPCPYFEFPGDSYPIQYMNAPFGMLRLRLVAIWMPIVLGG
jgi:hypothetical protein